MPIVGVGIDRGGSDDRVRDFAANSGVTFTILRDPANRYQRTFRTTGYAGAFVIGVDFGAGWTSCIGPAPASLPTIAADVSVGEGMGLLAVYSLGPAIPLLPATAALDRFISGTSRLRRWLPRLQQASGVLILPIAALLLTNSLSRLNGYAGWSPLAVTLSSVMRVL